MTENQPDTRIQKKIKKILLESGFKKVATELHFSFTSKTSDDYSIDVCTIHGDHLILIECKKSYPSHSSKFNKEIDHAIVNSEKISKGKTKNIKSSDLGKITLSEIQNITDVHYGFVIEETHNKEKTISKKLESHKMAFWNENAINHFYNSAKVLGSAAQYEILNEFNIKSPPEDFHAEQAVKIKQNENELYLLGMHPSILLRMAYVYRRISTRPSSYQRVISKQRLPIISDFYKKNRNLLLANSVIIAFDEDKEIQKEVEWNRSGDGKLHFPTSYACAWIIDGQHRVYAFKDTKYGEIPTTAESKKFKLPVVAFKKLPTPSQSRTFVDINYYQQKINTILIYDLVSSYPDLKYELTWACLLVKKLNELEPWAGKIQTTQYSSSRPITITSFVRPVLLEKLLGYNPRLKKNQFQGSLFKASPFFVGKKVKSIANKDALKDQLDILTRFFQGVKNNAEKQWNNDRTYGLTRFAGVNALLLTLTSILKKYKKGGVNFDNYLATIGSVKLTRKRISKLPRGYIAINKLHDEMIEAINAHNNGNLQITKL